MSNISDLALQIAIGEIGKEEIPRGSNWGENVEKYLQTVGINFPASWCMALMYWCFDQAAHKLSLTNPLFKTGGVLAQWNNRVSCHIAPTAVIQAGDIFIMDFGRGLGHTGIVESVSEGVIHTIEGNTNDTGSREGYEVCRKQRKIASPIIGFLRF